ncbi:hypothetical protein EJB05_33502, partial [Eragrostis curvula]
MGMLERCLMMPGAAHHQGNLSLDEYAERWSASHGGQAITSFQAFALSHKGKATSDVQYNPEDHPSAYSNPTAYRSLSSYSEVAKEVHGPDIDPSTHDVDGEVVMRVGGGKKHGRYYLGDSTLDMASTPTLSQIRARRTSDGPTIRSRPTTAHLATQALEVQLKNERKKWEELEARVAEQQR